MVNLDDSVTVVFRMGQNNHRDHSYAAEMPLSQGANEAMGLGDRLPPPYTPPPANGPTATNEPPTVEEPASRERSSREKKKNPDRFVVE